MTVQSEVTPKATAIDLLQSSLIVAERTGITPKKSKREHLMSFNLKKQHSSETVKAAKMLQLMGYSIKNVHKILCGTNLDRKLGYATVQSWLRKTNPKRCIEPEDCLSAEEIQAAAQQAIAPQDPYARDRDISGRFLTSDQDS